MSAFTANGYYFGLKRLKVKFPYGYQKSKKLITVVSKVKN